MKSNGEINEKFKWYIGPNDYYVTKEYDYNISESIWFGWGIFGWINKNIMFPLYNFLSSSFSAGLSIILMVIFLRLVMSPVQYKLYLGQAKMRILKPEITAVSEKYKDDPMKRNQETMKIYNQSGANPLGGCLPALIQLPVFYALFCFFPVAFELLIVLFIKSVFNIGFVKAVFVKVGETALTLIGYLIFNVLFSDS